MSARPRLALADQMTIEEFLGFTGTRPDKERWELIEGVPVLNASPVDYHQVVVANLTTFLMNEKRRLAAPWLPMPGIGTRVPISQNSLPQPDVFVMAGPLTGLPETSDAIVIFEVLSRSNTKADQAWRRRVYASVPRCQHYVAVSMKAAKVTSYDRSTGWKTLDLVGLKSTLALPAIGIEMPLAEVYRYTPLEAVDG
jgi:Uma2 family endonuclease